MTSAVYDKRGVELTELDIDICL